MNLRIYYHIFLYDHVHDRMIPYGIIQTDIVRYYSKEVASRFESYLKLYSYYVSDIRVSKTM